MEEKQGDQSRVEGGSRQNSSSDSFRGSLRAQVENQEEFSASPPPCANGEKPPSLAQPSVLFRFSIYRPYPQDCPLTTRAGPRSCPWSICFSFFFFCCQAYCTCHDPCNFNKDFPEYLLLIKVGLGVCGHLAYHWLNPVFYSFAKQRLCVLIWML